MRQIRAYLFVAVLLCSPGCLSFSGDKLEWIDPPPAKRAVTIEVGFGDFLYQVDGGSIYNSAYVARKLNEDILDCWADCGYVTGFRQRGRSPFKGNADFTLTLTGAVYGESSVLLDVLSTMTLTIIPTAILHEGYLTYELVNTETGEVFAATVEEDMTRTFWLPFILGAPFQDFGQAHAIDKAALHLYKKFADQGAFDRREETPEVDGEPAPVEQP